MSNRVCLVDGCGETTSCCGYCSSHYHRLKRYGSPLGFSKNGRRDGIINRHPREYNSYKAMKSRCLNKNHNQYHNYGGRGIGICDRWLEKPDGFRNFLEDMGERPVGTTLNRINNNEGYTPDNCKWDNWQEQQNNRRSNVVITYMGETHTVSDWGKKLGVKRSTIYMRVRNGNNVDDILSTHHL